MNIDESGRPRLGIVACLAASAADTLRLTFTDATTKRTSEWRADRLYTSIDLDKTDVINGVLTPKQYQEIGEALIMRLAVLHGRP